jgi:ABC-type nitrate/sulfonate/bicarbonate transport system permease component
MKNGIKRLEILLPFVGVGVLLAIWSLTVWARVVDPVLLPSPIATFKAMWAGMIHGKLGVDFLKTVERTIYSTAIAAVIAIPLGILLGSSEKLYRSVEFLIDFFRSTPATAMFPLFMLLFGLGDQGKIALAAFSALLIIVFNVAYGVLNARKTRIMAARSMGAGRIRIFADVIFLETLPQTFVGLRAGVSLALVVIVVAEMFIGGMDGMGHRIMDDQMSYNLKDMYGSLILSGAMGYCLNYGFLLVERYFVHWAGH